MTRTYLLSAALVLISAAYPATAWSQPQYGGVAKPMLLAQNQKVASSSISKEQAIRIARRQVSGKVLSANLVKRGPQQHYRVKMLTDNGRVKTVVVNAKR